MRSPTLLPIRMNAADTSASSAIADWTPLTVVSRSRTTAEIDTFISDVSTTRTNIAVASRNASRGVGAAFSGMAVGGAGLRLLEPPQGELVRRSPAVGPHPRVQAAILEIGDLDSPGELAGAAGGARDQLDVRQVGLMRARARRPAEQPQRTQLVVVESVPEQLVLGHGCGLERLVQPRDGAGFAGRPDGDAGDVPQKRR